MQHALPVLNVPRVCLLVLGPCGCAKAWLFRIPFLINGLQYLLIRAYLPISRFGIFVLCTAYVWKWKLTSFVWIWSFRPGIMSVFNWVFSVRATCLFSGLVAQIFKLILLSTECDWSCKLPRCPLLGFKSGVFVYRKFESCSLNWFFS